MVKHSYVGKAKYTFLAHGNAKVNKTEKTSVFLLLSHQKVCIFYFENQCLCVCFVYSLWILVSAFYSKT